MDFNSWLKKMSRLSDTSIYKYSHAIVTISDMMLLEKVISKPILEMELYELDLAIAVIFNTPSFVLKNETGNRMYSIALKWFRNYRVGVDGGELAVQTEINKITADNSIIKTEKEAIVKARIGQGVFRSNLINKYRRCIISQIDIPQLLVASHIKPWSVSSNNERVSTENGLLLSATYDRLFDSGLITFDKVGKIKLSSAINFDNRNRLHLIEGKQYDLQLVPLMKEFIEYHNDVVFVR